MNHRSFALFCLLAPCLATYAQSPPFSRFTDELTQLLETDAATVMVRGMTHDFAAKLCARLGGQVAQDVESEVVKWRTRNDGIVKGAARALDEFGNRHVPEGGESAKQGYLQMVLQTTARSANQRVTRQLNGANLDNSVVPSEQACSGLARLLREGAGDFQN